MTASRYQSRTFIGHSNIITHNTSIVEQSDWHLSACILPRLPKSVTTSFEFNCLVLFAKPRNTADSRVVFSQNSHNGHHRARPSGQVYTESLESKIGHMFYLCHCCIVQSVMVYSIKMSGWRLTRLPIQHVRFKVREFFSQNAHNSHPKARPWGRVYGVCFVSKKSDACFIFLIVVLPNVLQIWLRMSKQCAW